MSSPIEIKYVVYNGENDEFGDIRGELQITFQVQNTKINYGINFARNIKQYYDLSVGIVNGNQTEFINNISLNTRWRLACRMDKISDTFTGIQYDLSNPEIIKVWVQSDTNGNSYIDIPANENTFTQMKEAIKDMFKNCTSLSKATANAYA